MSCTWVFFEQAHGHQKPGRMAENEHECWPFFKVRNSAVSHLCAPHTAECNVLIFLCMPAAVLQVAPGVQVAIPKANRNQQGERRHGNYEECMVVAPLPSSAAPYRVGNSTFMALQDA